MINANRNHSTYKRYASTVFADAQSGSDTDAQFLGPLAGMLAAMSRIETPFLVTAPCDSPMVPSDLVNRLWQAREGAGVAISVAHDGDRLQPVFCLLDVGVRNQLEEFLSKGERKIDRFFAAVGYALSLIHI